MFRKNHGPLSSISGIHTIFFVKSDAFSVSNEEIVRETRSTRYIRSVGTGTLHPIPNTAFKKVEDKDLDNVHKLRLRRVQQNNHVTRTINLTISPRRRPRGNIRMPAGIVQAVKTENLGIALELIFYLISI